MKSLICTGGIALAFALASIGGADAQQQRKMTYQAAFAKCKQEMGGGGLDYYDTTALLFVGLEPPKVASPEEIAAAKKTLEDARTEFQAIFNKPEGKELAADGKPKQFHARKKMEQAQEDLDSTIEHDDPLVQR